MRRFILIQQHPLHQGLVIAFPDSDDFFIKTGAAVILERVALKPLHQFGRFLIHLPICQRISAGRRDLREKLKDAFKVFGETRSRGLFRWRHHRSALKYIFDIS